MQLLVPNKLSEIADVSLASFKKGAPISDLLIAKVSLVESLTSQLSVITRGPEHVHHPKKCTSPAPTLFPTTHNFEN
jgi:hypothetical protein